MKGKSFHLAGTTKESSLRWNHPDPEDMRKLLECRLDAKSARALRRHLRSSLDCALLAGRVAAIQGTDLEMTS